MKYGYDEDNQLLVLHEKGFQGEPFLAVYRRRARLLFESLRDDALEEVKPDHERGDRSDL